MTHPDQARVEGLIERLKAAKEVLRRAYGALYEIDVDTPALDDISAELRAINVIFDDADALSELRSLRASPSAGEPGTCQRCQGNGEIVTDWERYTHPHDGDKGDEATAECPDCNGSGKASPSAVTREPSGWKLMPNEPTENMQTAFYRDSGEPQLFPQWFSVAYREMLASAPEPETQPVEGWQPSNEQVDAIVLELNTKLQFDEEPVLFRSDVRKALAKSFAPPPIQGNSK